MADGGYTRSSCHREVEKTLATSMEVSCLGRPFSLGALYDCRTESLTPGLGLWRQEGFRRGLVEIEKTWSEGSIESDDNWDKKARALKINGDAKLSVLAGLIDVSGAAEYLNDEKSSSKVSRAVLSYQCTSRVEAMTMEQITEPDFEAPEGATHVVIAVLYGANAFIVFDYQHNDSNYDMKLAGNLNVIINKFVNVDGREFALDLKNEEQQVVDKVSCKFHGDFQPLSNPTTSQEAKDIYRSLPRYLTPEKQVPIRVWLYPVGRLPSVSKGTLFHSIGVDLIDQVVTRIEQTAKCSRLVNDLLEEDVNDFEYLVEKIRWFIQSLERFKSLIKQRLHAISPRIRTGERTEQDIFELMQEWDTCPFNQHRLDRWLRYYKGLSVVLKRYKAFFAEHDNIENCLNAGSLEACLLDRAEYTVVHHFHLNTRDAQLEAMKTCTRDRSLVRYVDEEEEMRYRSATEKMVVAAKAFIDFAACNRDNRKIKFVFSEHATQVETVRGSISVYQDRRVVAEDYTPPSSPGAPVISENDGIMVVKWEPPRVGRDNVTTYKLHYSLDRGRTRLTKTVESNEIVIEQVLPAPRKFRVEVWCRYGMTGCSQSPVSRTGGGISRGTREYGALIQAMESQRLNLADTSEHPCDPHVFCGAQYRP